MSLACTPWHRSCYWNERTVIRIDLITLRGGGGGGGGRVGLRRLLLLQRVDDSHGGLRHAADGEGEAGATAVLHRSRRRRYQTVQGEGEARRKTQSGELIFALAANECTTPTCLYS
jgi:hypothetical protein